MEKIVSRKTPTEGYEALVEAGMEDYTFEAVVLRHPECFSDEALDQARRRIDDRNAKEASA